MQNPLLPKIVTFLKIVTFPKIVILFLVPRKCHYYEWKVFMLRFYWLKMLRIPMSSTFARLGIGRKRKKVANCNDFNAKEIGR